MNTKHTPGPWTRGYKDDQTIYSGAKRVASVICAERQWEANARLIAAAPDLLETLENIRSAAFGSAKATAGDATRAAEALTTLGEWAAEAIAKATGQQ